MKPSPVIPASADVAQPADGARRRIQQVYILASGLLALVILAQVFLAGGGMFAEPGWWPTHMALGMALTIGPLMLLALGIAARLPTRLLWLNGLLLALVVLQPFLMSVPEQLTLPMLKAFHVVNALLIFGLTALLGLQVWRRFTSPLAPARAG